MDDGTCEEGALPEPLQAAVRAYLSNLKVTVILGEITGQLEAMAAGNPPSPEMLAAIRRGIDDMRRDNEAGLAKLGRDLHRV